MLRGLASPECRYLLALCCYKLRRLPEAERALLGTPSKTATKPGGGSVSLEPTLDRVPAGAAGFHLLGLICKETGRRRAAVSRFSDALSLDPFLWCAHEELCGLGAGEEARDAMMAAAATSDRYPPLAEIGGIVDARAGDGIFPPPVGGAGRVVFARARERRRRRRRDAPRHSGRGSARPDDDPHPARPFRRDPGGVSRRGGWASRRREGVGEGG